MKFEMILPEFLEWLAKEEGKAPNTVRKYAKIVRTFVQENGCVPTLVAQVQHWRNRIECTRTGVPASANYINLQLAAVRAFYAFLIEQGYVKEDPTRAARRKRVPKRLPRPLSQDEIRQVLDSILERKEGHWKQDLAIVQICYGSGLRRSEAACLTLDNIESAGVVRVIGKGDKERNTCMITPGYRAVRDLILDKYADDVTYELMETLDLSSWPQLTKEEAAEFRLDTLFFDLKNRTKDQNLPIFFTATGRPLSELSDPGHYIWQRFTACCEAVGFHAAPHRLRHSFGTHLLDEGANLIAVAEAMGHSSLDTTRGYTEVGTKQLTGLKQALEKAGAV